MSMDERTMLDSMGATSDDEGRAVALVSAVAASLWVTKGSPSDAPQAQRARPRRYLNAATRGAQSICFENSLCEGQDCEAQVLSQIRESIQCLMEPPGADDRCGRLEAREGARAGWSRVILDKQCVARPHSALRHRCSRATVSFENRFRLPLTPNNAFSHLPFRTWSLLNTLMGTCHFDLRIDLDDDVFQIGRPSRSVA